MSHECRFESLEKRAYFSTYAGVVFDDVNHNGVRDAGEAGLKGVTVVFSWSGERDAYTDASDHAVTDESGAFAITPLDFFEHDNMAFGIQVWHGWTQTAPAGDGWYEVPKGNRSDLHFGMHERRGTATGKLFLDANANGVRDIGEAYDPAAGVQPSFYYLSGGVVPEADGSFSLPFRVGTHNLILQSEFERYELGKPVLVELVDDQTTDLGDIPIVPRPARVRGSIGAAIGGAVVFADLNGDGVRQDGEPSATTSNAGIYELALSPAGGTYTVVLERGATFIPMGLLSRTVTLAASETKLGVNFSVRRIGQDLFARLPTDFDGDRYQDLVYRDPSTGAYRQMLVYPDVTRLGPAIVAPGDGWTPAAVADFNADGRPDYAWHNDSTGQTRIELRPSGDGAATFVDLQTVADTNWRVVGAGDFDGDGKFDLLWRKANTGQATVWRMDGTTHVGYRAMPWVSDTNWKIAAVADLDGDLDADVVWENLTTSGLSQMFLNGSAATFRGGMRTAGWTFLGLVQGDGNATFDLLWQRDENKAICAWLMSDTYKAYAYRIYKPQTV